MKFFRVLCLLAVTILHGCGDVERLPDTRPVTESTATIPVPCPDCTPPVYGRYSEAKGLK